MDNPLDTPGQKTVNDTLDLARLIADLCLSSGLKSHAAVQCAIDIARRLIEADACETRVESSR